VNEDRSHEPDDAEPSASSGSPVPPPEPDAAPGPAAADLPTSEQGPTGSAPPVQGTPIPPGSGYGPQTPPPYGYGQQPPPSYGDGTPPPYGYGQQPPPYGFGPQNPPPYGYGPPTPPPYGYGPQQPYGYVDPTAAGLPNPWSLYYPGPADPLVSPDFAGWWNRSITLLKAAWRPLVGIQLFAVLPITAVTIVAGLTIGRRAEDLVTTNDNGQVDFHALVAPLLAEIPVLLATFVFSLIVPLAMIHVVVRIATGRPVSVAGALMAGLRRILPMFGWLLLAGLLELVGLLFCILPGLYAIAAMAVLPVIVLLEPGNGIGRSFKLFHADVGASLGRLLTMFALAMGGGLAESAISAVIQAGSSAGPAAIGIVLTALVSGAVSLASGVLLAPMYVTTYADMRARHEPFSTAYLAAA